MTSKDRQVLLDNPDLPIYVWVDGEVFGGDDYHSWLGKITSLEVTEITMHSAGSGCGWDRVWERSEADELALEYIADDASEYLEHLGEWTYKSGEGFSLNGKRVTDEELEALAKEYVASLPWEKCILMWVSA